MKQHAIYTNTTHVVQKYAFSAVMLQRQQVTNQLKIIEHKMNQFLHLATEKLCTYKKLAGGDIPGQVATT